METNLEERAKMVMPAKTIMRTTDNFREFVIIAVLPFLYTTTHCIHINSTGKKYVANKSYEDSIDENGNITRTITMVGW